jgi:hypothetical protein
MLFAATTINYMDRQVLALLKPTLMHSVAKGGIGLTEESFGTVVAFFTLFYALGQLGAGRFVDKVGTRIGYMVIMASGASRRWATRWSTRCSTWHRALLSWYWRIRQLPRRQQNQRRVVPAERALVLFRHLQLRRQCRRDPGHAPRAPGNHTLAGTPPF